jgi:hypothetical protein
MSPCHYWYSTGTIQRTKTSANLQVAAIQNHRDRLVTTLLCMQEWMGVKLLDDEPHPHHPHLVRWCDSTLINRIR